MGISPAQPAGIFALPFSTIKATLPVLSNPFDYGSTVRISLGEFHYCFGNHLSEKESQPLYERYAIPSVAHVLWQGALGLNKKKTGDAHVEFDKVVSLHLRFVSFSPLRVLLVARAWNQTHLVGVSSSAVSMAARQATRQAAPEPPLPSGIPQEQLRAPCSCVGHDVHHYTLLPGSYGNPLTRRLSKTRAPLLLIAGTKDHVVPRVVVEKEFKAYKKGEGQPTVELKLFEGKTHGIVNQAGWQEVADYALAFAERERKSAAA